MVDDLYNFLRKVPLLADLPDSDLQKICRDVIEVNLAPGEILFNEGEIGMSAYVIIEGQIEIFKTLNKQKLQLALRGPGEVIGEISLLEKNKRNASGVAVTDSSLILINHDLFEQLLLTSPSAARTMLHTVITRLHSTEASLRQSEKMAQLGIFTAGITHEINNPASAVQRGAEQLKAILDSYQTTLLDLCSGLDNEEQFRKFNALRQQIRERAESAVALDVVTRMDREAALETWISGLGIEDAWELTSYLTDLDYGETELQKVIDGFSPESWPTLLRWITIEVDVQHLLNEIHEGSSRVSEIIKALKSYIFLDQAPNQVVDIHEGLENTLVILRHKLKQGIEVLREYDRSIPSVSAYGSELNQVWTNLIDNAIDAMDGKGRIIIRTAYQDDRVTVEIEDNGSGILPEVQKKLFYPFFTTKPVGKGTGLGLNISYKIVQKHGGDIQVFSKPGKTRFVVQLPTGNSHEQDEGKK